MGVEVYALVVPACQPVNGESVAQIVRIVRKPKESRARRYCLSLTHRVTSKARGATFLCSHEQKPYDRENPRHQLADEPLRRVVNLYSTTTVSERECTLVETVASDSCRGEAGSRSRHLTGYTE